MFRSPNKENESTKNALPCRYLTSVFVAYFGHFSAIPVGCRFAVLSSKLETPMKQSETQAAVNSSKKLKSTRNSTETNDVSAATYFNPYIRQTFMERN